MPFALILSIALVVAGSAFLYRNLALLNDESKLDRFLRQHRHGKREVIKHGLVKAKERIRTGYLKVGIAVSTGMLVIGMLNLAKLAPTILW